MLGAILNQATSAMFERDDEGTILLRADQLPNEVLELFGGIWRYLQTGQWEIALTTLIAMHRWQFALSYLGIKDTTFAVGDGLACIILARHLVLLPRNFLSRPVCVGLDETACMVNKIRWPFDANCDSGTDALEAKLGSVRLCPDNGALYFKTPDVHYYAFITQHALLKGKRMLAFVIRRSGSNYPKYGSRGYVLFIRMLPKNQHHPFRRGLTQDFAMWPSFWFVAYLRCDSDAGLVKHCQVHSEILPGGLAGLSDGTIVLLSNVGNLRKARLAIFLVDKGDEIVRLPPVLVNLVAPQAHEHTYSKGGKGKDKGSKGALEHQLSSTEGRRARWEPTRTVHPEGRAPASVWISARYPQIVIVIHAVDGRVTVAQVRGLTGSIPERSQVTGGTGALHWSARSNTTRWDVWCRRAEAQRSFPYNERASLRRRYAVPVCRDVLAVLPRDSEIMIIHKKATANSPQLWRVPLPASGEDRPPSLITVVKGKGKSKLSGGWSEHRWYESASCPMPTGLLASSYPAICEASMNEPNQPEFEFQRWQLVDPQAPLLGPRHGLSTEFPIIGPVRGACKGGAKGTAPVWPPRMPTYSDHGGKGVGGHYPSTPSCGKGPPTCHRTWSQAPREPREGCFLEHWTTSACVQ